MSRLEEIFKTVGTESIINITVHGKLKESEYDKISIKPAFLKGKRAFQFEKVKGKQVFHSNVNTDKLVEELEKVSIGNFKNISVNAEDFNCEIFISKKDNITFTKKKKKEIQKVTLSGHNREKNYLLKEDKIIEPLIDIGVFTQEGKIVNSKYDKYKQINRYVEIVNDVVKNIDKEKITIIDFGCGKSYLSFILYYYLEKELGLNIEIIGLDLKEEVIKNCNEIAKKYNYKNLRFEVGNIDGYNYSGDVDIVITLHACDTATDYAIYNALKLNSKVILTVPCCQHEINAQIKTENFSILTKYGIVKERISALFTDTIRASLLECCGYKTQILEFVDIEHSPKNLLIRAVKSNVSKSKRDKSLQQVKELINEYNLSPTLYNLLKKDGYIGE